MSKPLKEEYKSIEKLDLKNISESDSQTFKHVNCPSCSTEVVADNINLSNSTAKCGNCNAIFSIQEVVESILTLKESKTEIFRPEGIDLFFYKDEMEITIQEQTKGWEALWVLLLVGVLGFAIAVYSKNGSIGALPVAGMSLLGALYFLYEWVTYSKYKTFIDVTHKTLSLRSRPKNIKKDKSYDNDEIDQLYLKHSTDGMGLFTIHMLVNGIDGQKDEKLVTVNSLSKAKYLEQEIERYLGIEDRPIPGAHF